MIKKLVNLIDRLEGWVRPLLGSNILTLMANRHPYSDAAAPRHVRARAVEIHEEEAAAQKIRRVMQRRKEGRGGEGRDLLISRIPLESSPSERPTQCAQKLNALI